MVSELFSRVLGAFWSYSTYGPASRGLRGSPVRIDPIHTDDKRVGFAVCVIFLKFLPFGWLEYRSSGLVIFEILF
jgi:hypothetical protein